MKIAIAQLNPTIGDLGGNASKIAAKATQAQQQGADLLLTPELSLCGYPPKDLLLNPGFLKSLETTVSDLSQKLLCPSLVGTVTFNSQANLVGEKNLHNSIAFLANQRVEQTFQKRLLPTYDVFNEHRYFASGKSSGFLLFKSPQANYLKIGVTICEDLWNDEQFWGKRSYRINPLAELASLGVDLIVNLSASPYSVGKQKLREKMLIHAAIRYGIPMIYVNQVGGNDDLIFDGRSVAVNRQGKVVGRALGFEEDLLILDFDEATKDLVGEEIEPLAVNELSDIWSALVLGVQDYVRKCGFRQVVLGLSGGIDSALVAAIAAAALKPENVLGVMMPSPYSSSGSLTDAVTLGENLGIKSQKLPIEGVMQSYDAVLASLFADTTAGVAEENLQSRIRGNLLMAIANKFNYLLLSTGNKSELAVGYCTLYGDMNGGLAVIADLPKTLVYQLCHWLNRNGEVIPENILVKPPSAELKPDQVDQDSLPPYEILDDILDQLICQHHSISDIVATGHEIQVVSQVIQMVARAEFKRKQAPPGLKVTDRAFGTGWCMPIACKITQS